MEGHLRHFSKNIIGKDCQSDAILNDINEIISNPEHRRDDEQEGANSEIRKLISDLKELIARYCLHHEKNSHKRV